MSDPNKERQFATATSEWIINYHKMDSTQLSPISNAPLNNNLVNSSLESSPGTSDSSAGSSQQQFSDNFSSPQTAPFYSNSGAGGGFN